MGVGIVDPTIEMGEFTDERRKTSPAEEISYIDVRTLVPAYKTVQCTRLITDIS